MRLRLSWVLTVAGPLTLMLACGGDDDGPSASGGSAGNGTGGRAAAGSGGRGEAGEANAGTGDVPPEGGMTGQGGATSGGTSTTGGVVSEGGATSGGTNTTGGTSGGTGGSVTTGGNATSGTGGAATGGISSGGASGSGGEGADSGAGGEGGGAGADNGEVVLKVNPSAKGAAISPNIYGINVTATSPQCSNPSAHFGLCRLGGSRFSAYNWENNASNAGNALCFQNDDALGTSNDPGLKAKDLLTDAGGKASALLTIPMLPYVAADKTAGSAAPDCSGDVRKTTPGNTNYLATRFKQNRALKGSAFTLTPDTSDAFVNQDEFVNFVRDRAAGAPVLFALDNESELWNYSHPEVFAAPPPGPTYAGMVARNIEYASMVRATWPEAKVLGYVGYGWNSFVNLQGASDAAGKGEFIDFYLDSMKTADTNAGKRLVDYLDIHWFPELYVNGGQTRIIESIATPEAQRVRVQAPRSLWDTSYVEDGWIPQSTLGGAAIRLIPRMQDKFAAHYPGTALAISEWNYGGETDISGAIAAADALGVFGREGVGVAAFKSFLSTTPSFVLGAFAAFRNYDGAGAHFGDTSVSATSSDVAKVSVYASTDSAVAGRVVIIVINRAEVDTATSLRIQGSASFASAALYQLSSSAALPSAKGSVSASSGNTFSLTLPAYSISVLVPAP